MLQTAWTYAKQWFHEKSTAPLPQTLLRKRVYILPTRYGLLFIGVLFGMLLGSVNHNNNLGFLLTFLLSAMTFISMLYTYRNLLGLRILSVTTTPVFSEDDAVFEFLVRIDGASRAAVDFTFADGDTPATADLEPQSDNRIRVYCKTVCRGVLNPGPVVISTQFPFGLFRAWSRLNLFLECLVYPRPVPAALIPGNGEFSKEGTGTRPVPGVEDFMGLRLYQPGDSLQHISWKTYSRGQGLFTKTFAGQSGTSIVLDWRGIKETDTEKRLSMLCDMVLKAHHQQLTFGLWLPGTVIEPDRGEAHKRNCLKALALFPLPEQR